MKLNQYIDHTILKPDIAVDAIIRLCTEAVQYDFAAVCINPCYLDLATHLLAGTTVHVATVIGFPLGSSLSVVKAAEAREAELRKANELDMVINLGAAKMGLWQVVTEEIKQVVQAAESCTVKVIIETGALTDDEKKYACQAVIDAGAHYVKTSTGFGPGGATEEDVRLLKVIAGEQIGIKASGGIRTRQQAEALIAAGATRLGTSNGLGILNEIPLT